MIFFPPRYHCRALDQLHIRPVCQHDTQSGNSTQFPVLLTELHTDFISTRATCEAAVTPHISVADGRWSPSESRVYTQTGPETT